MTSIPEPARAVAFTEGTNYFNCDGINANGDIGGRGNYNDPVCPDPNASEVPSTFSLEGEKVCGVDHLYFRVRPGDPGYLDASTTDDYSNIVASCRKNPDCGNFGTIYCGSAKNTFYTAQFLCTPVNNSVC